MNRCERPCLFRMREEMENYHNYRCRYLEMTGHSRVKRVYDSLGIKEMNDAARRLLEPQSCPCFLPAPKEQKLSGRTDPITGLLKDIRENFETIRQAETDKPESPEERT